MKKQIVSALMMAVFTLVFLLSAGMLLHIMGKVCGSSRHFVRLKG